MKVREGVTAIASPVSHIGLTGTVPATPERIERLSAPPGFRVEVFARDLNGPRMLAVTPDGAVLFTRPKAGEVVAVRDEDGDGAGEVVEVVADGLEMVHGIALFENRVYLAGAAVWVAELLEGGRLGEPRVLSDALPLGGRHPKHTIGIGPDRMIYVSVGSSCDACFAEHPLRARMLRMNLDGTGLEVFAEGLRNVQGFDWHPGTKVLWGMDNGADHRGDQLPPEELNRIEQGLHYGWPFAFGERMVDPITDAPEGVDKLALTEKSTPMVMGYAAHTSPMGFTFYRGEQFPESFRNDAFVAMRGSWNREPPAGYEVIRIRFQDGVPMAIEPFVTGWLLQDTDEHFGRPVGIAELNDGSLLVGDDVNGVLYRIRYVGMEVRTW